MIRKACLTTTEMINCELCHLWIFYLIVLKMSWTTNERVQVVVTKMRQKSAWLTN